MTVQKASASVVSYVCSLQAIFLSKITPRYFTLSTNSKSWPFNVRSESKDVFGLKEWIPRVLCSLIFISQRSHQAAFEDKYFWKI
jgi:hypothetical protein